MQEFLVAMDRYVFSQKKDYNYLVLLDGQAQRWHVRVISSCLKFL